MKRNDQNKQGSMMLPMLGVIALLAVGISSQSTVQLQKHVAKGSEKAKEKEFTQRLNSELMELKFGNYSNLTYPFWTTQWVSSYRPPRYMLWPARLNEVDPVTKAMVVQQVRRGEYDSRTNPNYRIFYVNQDLDLYRRVNGIRLIAPADFDADRFELADYQQYSSYFRRYNTVRVRKYKGFALELNIEIRDRSAPSSLTPITKVIRRPVSITTQIHNHISPIDATINGVEYVPDIDGETICDSFNLADSSSLTAPGTGGGVTPSPSPTPSEAVSAVMTSNGTCRLHIPVMDENPESDSEPPVVGRIWIMDY